MIDLARRLVVNTTLLRTISFMLHLGFIVVNFIPLFAVSKLLTAKVYLV